MTRTVTYLIIVARTSQGYAAYAPAFPEIAAGAASARLAYGRVKALIKAKLLAAVAAGKQVPRDPVVQTRHLRLDLWYLRQQEELQ